jgi:DNA-binding transcriptional regulator YiaG
MVETDWPALARARAAETGMTAPTFCVVTPAQLRNARAALGLSAAKLARALRLGAGGGRTVRRWEAGANPIPGPAQVAVEMMLAMRARAAGEG